MRVLIKLIVGEERKEGSFVQSVGMGVRVCKSVCIEEKISGREVADYIAS